MSIHDYSTGEMPGEDDPQWDTAQMQVEFEPIGFAAPYIVVRRRSDGVKGTLQFNHDPRVYFDFQPS